MSLETLLRDLRENYPERELAVVFGATGGKGVDRRTTMGIAAGKYADRIVITEDDPGPRMSRTSAPRSRATFKRREMITGKS